MCRYKGTPAIAGRLCSRHKTIDDLLLTGFFERDGEFVAIDPGDMAVTELLMEDAVAQGEFRVGAGRLGNQFAFDRHRFAVEAPALTGVITRAGLVKAAAAAA